MSPGALRRGSRYLAPSRRLRDGWLKYRLLCGCFSRCFQERQKLSSRFKQTKPLFPSFVESLAEAEVCTQSTPPRRQWQGNPELWHRPVSGVPPHPAPSTGSILGLLEGAGLCLLTEHQYCFAKKVGERLRINRYPYLCLVFFPLIPASRICKPKKLSLPPSFLPSLLACLLLFLKPLTKRKENVIQGLKT